MHKWSQILFSSLFLTQISLTASAQNLPIVIFSIADGARKSDRPKPSAPIPSQVNCDRAYPDFCLPPNSRDLDCQDIPYSQFRVISEDPHKFDSDKDGIGCES